ncbi:glycosyltransferase family 2 protein [Microlunatus capsulatus]|uniref:4,4'-diaponeurosporenoate glycosyltransferase n=1 Tax=Microlunatus capsulatus TaxID=99117 RepID=A0ABS4Z5N0_9ACTN|nr:glycosyltransferase family 2 protein [Microlunatus capsulatus]MBP2416348.1 glycosyltransferase involved in cell wall biosynthesis [Microlunatus capsulatus]
MSARSWPGVSVVMPVLNEERHLAAAVGRVLDQQYPGELEVLLVVGPSRDATRTIADELAAGDPRIRVVDNPAGRTPHALNLGVAAAHHDVVVRVDGHGELTNGYIARAVELLEETGAANVGGVMDAQGRSAFEQAVASAYTTRLGLGGSAFHLAGSPAGEAETVFLGVFRKEALQAVGGFDETMHRAQDWELNYRLRGSGRRIWFSPELRVTYRPRSSLRALLKQMYDTGKWRREVVRRHPETANLRYLAPPAAVSGIAVGTAAGALGLATGSRLLRLGLAAPLGYLAVVLAGAATAGPMPARARAWLPVVLAATHLSWGSGFLVGLRRRRP